MSTGVHTLVLRPQETFEDAFDNPNRWIDHLPNVSAAEIAMLLDYLSSEFGINLPSTIQASVPIGYRIVAALTRHDANCLRTRLKKKVQDLSLKEILQAYSHAGDGDTEWWNYFCRQSQHCQTDDCSLVLLVSSATDISEELYTQQ
ncbi:MAG: hypothetical protein ABL888_18240 [Pirellulaceae bacterium]